MAKVVTNGLGIELRGKAGNAVFASTRFGVVLRSRTQPHNPQTPAQIAARQRLGQVSAAFKTLTPEQRREWEAYARSVAVTNRAGTASAVLTAQTAFIGLGSKYLQTHPAGSVPLSPPTVPFFGDGITITATGEASQITFTASGPNAANIVTELLLQPLAHGSRAPKANLYRPQAFVAFASGSLSRAVTLAPGWYAPAYRFVHALTGQEVGMARLTSVQTE